MNPPHCADNAAASAGCFRPPHHRSTFTNHEWSAPWDSNPDEIGFEPIMSADCIRRRWSEPWDSNPHCVGFKPTDSAVGLRSEWSPRRESNPQNPASKTGMYASSITGRWCERWDLNPHCTGSQPVDSAVGLRSHGAGGEIRTHTVTVLSRVTLPLAYAGNGPPRRIRTFTCQIKSLLCRR